MSEKNPYNILHLHEDCTYEELKDRYRHLSRALHPDKQPPGNYELAQKHFKEIDQAYKSIATEVRRFVFKQFGPHGIFLIDAYPGEFVDIQGLDMDIEANRNKVRQLVLYLMHEEHANTQIEQKSLRTVTMFLVWWPVSKTKEIPKVQKYDCQYEMPLPAYKQYTSTFKVGYSTKGLTNNMKANLGGTLAVSRRFQNSLLATLTYSISGKEHQQNLTIQKTLNPNLQVYGALSARNQQISPMEFGFTKNFQSFYVSGKSNFQDHDFEIGVEESKESKRSIRLAVQDGEAIVGPMIEKQIAKNVRIFAQAQVHSKYQNGEIQAGVFVLYGYRLSIINELKLQLASYIGGGNSRLSINLITPKFRASFPILSHGDYVVLEAYKVSLFVSIYLIYNMYNYIKQKNKRFRERLAKESYNRISHEKNTLHRIQNEIQIQAGESQEREMRQNGLVIIGAFYGHQKAISSLLKSYQAYIRQYKKDHHQNEFNQEVSTFFEEKKKQIRTSFDDSMEQIFDVTKILQAQVIGAQINNFSFSQLNINPCLNESHHPVVLVISYSRGEISQAIFSKNISIGTLCYEKKRPIWHKFNALLRKFIFAN